MVVVGCGADVGHVGASVVCLHACMLACLGILASGLCCHARIMKNLGVIGTSSPKYRSAFFMSFFAGVLSLGC